jgi:cell division protein YceG involved in septum cleavage
MSFSFFNEKSKQYINFFPQKMSSNKQVTYMTSKIREGYEPADITMWQNLLQQAKTDEGNSHEYLFLLLDMAQHNECDVLEIVKTGRVCSNAKSINEDFISSLRNCVNVDDDDASNSPMSQEGAPRKQAVKVLDLTCEESSLSSSSHSYEETSEPYNANPTSAEAYEIDGFVAPDTYDDDVDDKRDVLKKIRQFDNSTSAASDWLLERNRSTSEASTADAVPKAVKARKLKRRQTEISQE